MPVYWDHIANSKVPFLVNRCNRHFIKKTGKNFHIILSNTMYFEKARDGVAVTRIRYN